MDWKKYPLIVKNNNNNPVIVVYKNNSSKELNSDINQLIEDSTIKLITKDYFEWLNENGCTDIYNRIDLGNSLDVRNQEDHLDYVRDFIYFPDLEIGIIDSEDFLELKYNDLEDFRDMLLGEKELFPLSIHRDISKADENHITSLLSEIGYKTNLAGSVRDEDYNCYLVYKTSDNKNIYIEDTLHTELVKELSLNSNSTSIESSVSELDNKMKDDSEIEL